jgi:predicted oxidoreductase
MKTTFFSRIIAGTMSWGSWGKALNTSQMQQLMHHCIENGITTFDHADIYGGYTTEAQFGKAFSSSGIKREDIQFISKCGIQYLSENRNNKVKHYDYRKDYIVWSVEESLKNLKTDYLDLLLLHRPSPLMHPDDIAKAIEKLTKQGKIKQFGVSNFTASQMQLIASRVPITVNQIQCSLTHFDTMLNGDLDYMMLNNITPMAWSPLGKIFKENNNQTQRIQQTLLDLMVKYEATADQLLLAWLMHHPTKIQPVIGTTDFNRITNAVKATHIQLEQEDWFLLLVASQGHKVP